MTSLGSKKQCQNVHILNQLTLSKSREVGFDNWKDAT